MRLLSLEFTVDTLQCLPVHRTHHSSCFQVATKNTSHHNSSSSCSRFSETTFFILPVHSEILASSAKQIRHLPRIQKSRRNQRNWSFWSTQCACLIIVDPFMLAWNPLSPPKTRQTAQEWLCSTCFMFPASTPSESLGIFRHTYRELHVHGVWRTQKTCKKCHGERSEHQAGSHRYVKIWIAQT